MAFVHENGNQVNLQFRFFPPKTNDTRLLKNSKKTFFGHFGLFFQEKYRTHRTCLISQGRVAKSSPATSYMRLEVVEGIKNDVPLPCSVENQECHMNETPDTS